MFVYGTLRRGGSNAFRMDGSTFHGSGTVAGRLYRISWYPGLVLDSEASRVTGDVFEATDEQLTVLDEFEGLAAGEIEGSEYRRVRATVLLENGDAIEAWVYEWKGSVSEAYAIPDGDWLRAEASF
ncbi:MAG: hypothetical protein JWO82_2691 [Akkermansiaceae bacterium]|nr:hypothetical protein [Akkermansiaceae bacterium]